ncbi:hypothetical protein [Roseibium sp.]|uniref:hypothetical protein n=1 Tax=Roseibium sp. TaxID=1936156 RepID=UPI00328CB87C
MPTFQITAPDGKKYRVTGENAEGAFQAVQAMAGGGLDSQQTDALARAKANYEAGTRPDVELSPEAARDPRANIPMEDTALNRAGAFTTQSVEGLPIVGPMLMGGVQRAAAGATSLATGDEYGDVLSSMQRTTERLPQDFPGTALAGNVAGNLAAFGGIGATTAGARALGMSQAGLGARMGVSAASSAGISGADTAARGGDMGDVAQSAALGGFLGGAVPLAGAGLQKGYRAAADYVGGKMRGAINPTRAAGERVGKAISLDRANPGDDVLGAVDDVTARTNNQQVMNLDRGGETTRALARAASNTNPEARATIAKAADDRFATQGGRTVDFVKRIMGGNVDDLALQDRIKDIARITNAKAYRAAEASPRAQQVWDGELQQLMQSPTVQKAAQGATSRSADRVAVEGGKAVRNPFVFDKGVAKLVRNADGSMATPNLRFWDQVKRNLDDEIGTAMKAGNRSRAADIQSIRSRLVQKLDGLVPEYQTARRGAAAAFGAEDAVEAGRNFARQTRNVPEMERAIAKFNPAEKKAFEVGYASEIVDKVRSTNDRVNAIRMFKSPEMRQKFELALGPQKTRELEAFIRVEDATDKIRGALGNSTTARQLVELGLAGGAGGAASIATGDPRYVGFAVAGALARSGMKLVNAKVDERVMKKVAEMLISEDPKVIERAIRQAAFSPQYLAAVDAISEAAGLLSRGAVVGTATGVTLPKQ